MFFMYVQTEASDNVGGESTPITISHYDKVSCVNKNVSVIRALVEAEGLDWDSVTIIHVETGLDHDEYGNPADSDNPDTVICYIRGEAS
jgi:hypothetical protein